MDTRPHSQICSGLNVSRARVDQWIARNIIRLETASTAGRSREWTKHDAMKLAVLVDLADAGLPLDKVSQHVEQIRGFKDDLAYLVIRYGQIRLVPASPRGAKPPPESGSMPVVMPGMLTSDILKESEVADFLRSAAARVAIIVPLKPIEDRLERIWNPEKIIKGG